MLLRKSAFLQSTARTLPSRIGPIRCLNVHEYISMEIMNKYGIATPAGFVASTPEEAESIFKTKMNTRTFYTIFLLLSFIKENAL